MSDQNWLLLGRSPMLWLRAGALVLIAVLCVSAVVTQSESAGFRPVLVCLCFAIYAVVFVANTAHVSRHQPWQIWLLAVQIVLSLPFDVNLAVVTAATIPLAIERRRWGVWLAAAVGAVMAVSIVRSALAVAGNWDKLPPGTSWTEVIVTLGAGMLEVAAWQMFAFLAAFLIVHFDEDRRRLAQLNAELKASQVLLMESGRLAERLRISRELHDSMGHHLTGLSLQLEIAEHLPEDQLRTQLHQARFMAKLLLADIREAISEWRGETSSALPDALRALADGMTGAEMALHVESEIPATSPLISHALFRCTQEAVTNAIRHGAARKIDVGLSLRETSLHLEIQDNGRGTTILKHGNGLDGIQSRVTEIGGTVRFSSAPGQGFRIEIQVPNVEVALQ